MFLRWVTFTAVVLSALSTAILPAMSEPIPIVDIDRICRDSINTDSIGGQVQVQYDTCFTNQQRAYDQIKNIWNSMFDDQQRTCVNKLSPQSRFIYSDLLACAREMQTQRRLDEERSRKEMERLAIPKREFRY